MSDERKIEIWALAWNNPEEAGVAYVAPALDDDGTNSFLAFPNERQAEIGAAFQRDNYDCECHPVRLA